MVSRVLFPVVSSGDARTPRMIPPTLFTRDSARVGAIRVLKEVRDDEEHHHDRRRDDDDDELRRQEEAHLDRREGLGGAGGGGGGDFSARARRGRRAVVAAATAVRAVRPRGAQGGLGARETVLAHVVLHRLEHSAARVLAVRARRRSRRHGR